MEKRISDWYGLSIKIVECYDNLGNLVSDSDISQSVKYVSFTTNSTKCIFMVNLNTLSGFSFRYAKLTDNPNQILEQCKKLSEFEEIIKHNFDSSCTLDHHNNEEINIDTQYVIYSFKSELYIENVKTNAIVCTLDINSATIYDILDYPLLQPFRINNSKPVNRFIID